MATKDILLIGLAVAGGVVAFSMGWFCQPLGLCPGGANTLNLTPSELRRSASRQQYQIDRARIARGGPNVGSRPATPAEVSQWNKGGVYPGAGWDEGYGDFDFDFGEGYESNAAHVSIA